MAYVKNINGYDIKDEEARNLISALDQRVTDLHAPYYVLIGDSYGYDAVRDGNSVTGWTTWFKQWNGLTEGTDCFSDSEAGAGFSNQSGSGRNFNDMVTYVASSMSDAQKNGVGTVIIAGGTNDMNNANIGADYVTLFNVLNTNIKTTFPNCRKVVVVPVGMNNSNRSNRLMAPRLYSYYEQACRNVGFSFAWGAWYFRYDKRYETSDHIHLNNNGTKICTSMIITALEGGSCGWYARETIHVTLGSDFASGDFDIEMIMQDGLITFNKTETNHVCSYSTDQSFQMNSTSKTIATYSSTILPDNCFIVYRASGRVHSSGSNVFYDAPVLIRIDSGNYNITMPYTDELSGYKTVSDCDFFGIDMNDFVASAFTM